MKRLASRRALSIASVFVGALGCAALGLLKRQLQSLPSVFLVRSDGCHADCCPLPEFLMICLGDGYVELRAQSILQPANDHAFIFEGLRMRNMDVQGKQGNGYHVNREGN